MAHTRLQYLFDRYFHKTASRAEIEELSELMQDEAGKEQVLEAFEKTWEVYEAEGEVLSPGKAEEMLQRILHTSSSYASAVERVGRFRWMKAAAAVALLVTLAGVIRWWVNRLPPAPPAALAGLPATDAKPGLYRASLMLADGRQIALDSMTQGVLARQGNISVINRNGRLIYRPGSGAPGTPVYNTLTAGRGETYAFTLADGSQVWLNAGSSVRFPVSFPGNERRIETSGEVYIKVARDPARTFVVATRGMDVQALGTEFDINAYSDEADVKTTLVNGSVRVTCGKTRVMLRPRQQVRLEDGDRLTPARDVDVEEVVSWKDGNFEFGNADIKTILRELARWYDVDVVYEGPIREKKFFCVVSRNSTLTNVLKMLKESDLAFRIEGQKLYVSSK